LRISEDSPGTILKTRNLSSITVKPGISANRNPEKYAEKGLDAFEILRQEEPERLSDEEFAAFNVQDALNELAAAFGRENDLDQLLAR
jgi:hypothetical protein